MPEDYNLPGDLVDRVVDLLVDETMQVALRRDGTQVMVEIRLADTPDATIGIRPAEAILNGQILVGSEYNIEDERFKAIDSRGFVAEMKIYAVRRTKGRDYSIELRCDQMPE